MIYKKTFDCICYEYLLNDFRYIYTFPCKGLNNNPIYPNSIVYREEFFILVLIEGIGSKFIELKISTLLFFIYLLISKNT